MLLPGFRSTLRLTLLAGSLSVGASSVLASGANGGTDPPECPQTTPPGMLSSGDTMFAPDSTSAWIVLGSVLTRIALL